MAGGPGTSAFCEVDTPDTFSLTHGERRYHYMAPCRVESVSADGLTIIAVVEYTNPGWCRDRYNGERLRLDFTEAGPPARHASSRARRAAARGHRRRTLPGPAHRASLGHGRTRAGWFHQGRESRPPMPPLQSDVLRASEMPELQQNPLPAHP